MVIYDERRNLCFKYCQPGHILRNCPSVNIDTRANKVSAATSLALMPKGATFDTGTG